MSGGHDPDQAGALPGGGSFGHGASGQGHGVEAAGSGKAPLGSVNYSDAPRYSTMIGGGLSGGPGSGPGGGGSGRQPLEPRQLELVDDDVRLPWLEGDDDPVIEGGPTARVWIYALLALLLLAGLGAGAWWLLGRGDPAATAEGGLIAAPDEPYKVRPDDPGGELVAGTGDTSYAVAEGESRAVQIARPDPEAAPAPDTQEPVAATPAASETAEALAGRVAVQVGAYTTRARAEQGWQTLLRTYAPLGEHPHRVVEGRADFGVVFRLQALSPDKNAARALCTELRDVGLACQVKG